MVRVFALGEVEECLYFERKGGAAYIEKMRTNGEWLPQLLASELHQRMVDEGPDAILPDVFIEEASNEDGVSLLVVDFGLFENAHHSICCVQDAKRSIAAAKLQIFWRRVRVAGSTKAIATRFYTEGTSLTEAKASRFEVFSARLRDDSVIEASSAMLLRVIQLCNYGRHHQPLIRGTVNVKIFLAAYMCKAHPNAVFAKVDVLERKLLESIGPMLEYYHETAKALMEGVPWAKVRVDNKMLTSLSLYLRIFKVKPLYLELCRPRNLNPKPRTFRNGSLLTRRSLLGGSGLPCAASRRQSASSTYPSWRCLPWPPWTRSGPCLENPKLHQRGLTAAVSRSELKAQQLRLREKLVEIAGQGELTAHDLAQQDVLLASVGEVVITPTTPVVSDGHVGGLTKEALAHELLLDINFHLEHAEESEDRLVHTRIRETFDKAYWESLVQSVSNMEFANVVRVLEKIVQGVECLEVPSPLTPVPLIPDQRLTSSLSSVYDTSAA
jgi:hypothetical protein